MIRRLNTGMTTETTATEIKAWIAQAAAAATQAIIIHPRPIRPHIYHPSEIDRLIDLLNDELDDEAKMRLVMSAANDEI